MKVIVSHDVDHITAWEHKGDLILPKHLMRNWIEFCLRYISPDEMIKRLGDMLRNRWNNLEALMEFDKQQGIPSTFFFGVENGAGLAYALRDAAFWANKASEEGFAVGVHGIAYERLDDIKKEFSLFARITKLRGFGIRMHYLRRNGETLKYLERAGYTFDSSFPEMTSPYRVGGLWEFPLHIMDGHILCRNARWQNQTMEQTRDATKAIVEKAFKLGIEYFTVLLHDRYFSDSFKTWREWYIWLIQYLRNNGLSFSSYDEAVKELSKSGTDSLKPIDQEVVI